jgi:hypothetical protein
MIDGKPKYYPFTDPGLAPALLRCPPSCWSPLPHLFSLAAGTPEPGGWTTREVKRIIRGLAGLNFMYVVFVLPVFFSQQRTCQMVRNTFNLSSLLLVARMSSQSHRHTTTPISCTIFFRSSCRPGHPNCEAAPGTESRGRTLSLRGILKRKQESCALKKG